MASVSGASVRKASVPIASVSVFSVSGASVPEASVSIASVCHSYHGARRVWRCEWAVRGIADCHSSQPNLTHKSNS